MRRHFSISLRLTFWFGFFFFLGWVLFGTAMWLNLRRTLTGERHQTLTRRVDRLQELLTRDQNDPEADRIQDVKDFAHATGNGLAEVFRPDGQRAFPSPSSAAATFSWPSVQDVGEERFLHTDSWGQPYWVLARPFASHGQRLILLVAAPESGNLLVLDSFWKGLLWSVPILLLIASAGGYWISRRALGPVDKITAKARSISIRNLSDRLPVADTGDELERLAETCNAMLVRLESAVNQIKQFTADASHELRGPLSFTRTVAEVALKNPHADPVSRQAFEDIVDEAAKATVLLEDMLTLARADADSAGNALEPVDLAAVVEESCTLARPVAEKLHLGLSMSRIPGQPVTVLGNLSSLRRLLWILLDNALKYTEAQGRIEVAVREDSGQAVVEVRDTGIGIAPADLPRIFDRFYRADPSRSHVEGNGLGLAIAKWIAELHHADFSVASEESIGTIVRFVLPICEG